jgi:2-polyprenyl-6-methoxyphenol hydroxylase-like FAD-dependent oxidoreductase
MSGEQPVLIVGAGPTGLSLAIELSRHGVPYRFVERAAVRSDKSRALAVQARSLELMRPWGVADALVARGQRTFALQMFVEKRHGARTEFSDIGVDDTPYPFILFVSQAETERLLDEALARLGGTMPERPVALVDARDEGDAVVATVEHGDGRHETARFDWVVGCDGAHSVVRRATGLDFPGGRYEQDFVLADVAIHWELPEQLYFFFGRGKNAVIVPLRDGLQRIIGFTGQPPPEGAGDEPPLAEFTQLLDAVCPVPFKLERPRWRARFRLHHRGVPRYRVGRFLVAGDAAHIHSPAGGQGMNAGIQDAVNLGWKLALVVRGAAPATLLDSYDEERRPVGQRLLQFTDRLFSLAASANPVVIWLRNRVIPFMAPRIFATPARRRLLFRFLSQLAIRYTGASLVGDCGERAPDAIVDGNHLHDAFAAPRHHLVVFGRGGEALVQRAQAGFAPWLDGLAIDDPIARRRYQIDGEGWVLVRPDGYVAARAQSFDEAPLQAYFAARIGINASKRSM